MQTLARRRCVFTVPVCFRDVQREVGTAGEEDGENKRCNVMLGRTEWVRFRMEGNRMWWMKWVMNDTELMLMIIGKEIWVKSQECILQGCHSKSSASTCPGFRRQHIESQMLNLTQFSFFWTEKLYWIMTVLLQWWKVTTCKFINNVQYQLDRKSTSKMSLLGLG